MIIAVHLERYIRSGAAGDEDSGNQEIIRPLTFDDWDAHEDFYMAILKEDAKALERYDAGEGEEDAQHHESVGDVTQNFRHDHSLPSR